MGTRLLGWDVQCLSVRGNSLKTVLLLANDYVIRCYRAPAQCTLTHAVRNRPAVAEAKVPFQGSLREIL